MSMSAVSFVNRFAGESYLGKTLGYDMQSKIPIDSKVMVMDAIKGAGFSNIEAATRMEKMGAARFTGDQHNPAWEWNTDWLGKQKEEMLFTIYYCMKSGRIK